MKTPVTFLLLLITTVSVGCAQNLWWEAERSGWVLFGTDVQVPRKAEALPLDMLAEASQWNQDVYVEAWIESVDQESGSWMTISDGTSAPVLVFFDQGFKVPRNARGRRTMTWGRPLTSSGSITNEDGETRTNLTIEFSAKAVLIQGFYGLESALPRDRSSSERAMPLPDLTTPAPTEVDSSSDDDMMLDLIEEDDSE
jgi:hypothetical protein